MPTDADRSQHDDSPDDSESEFLLSEFAAGDDTAFGKLVERETPGLRRRLEEKLPRQLRRRVGVSDIIQQTSIALLAARERFENQGYGAFRRLLETIADRVLAKCVDRERAAKRDVFRQIRAAPGDAGVSDPAQIVDRFANSIESPSRVAARQEEVEAMKGFLARLAPADREIIRLVDYQALGYDAVAERLGITVDAAKKRRSRAVARLREMMRKRER